ncbi:MAG: signal peptidase I [Ruminococcus sp.]|nr:signal peptidase I [Ruminococcus sp.]
MKVLKVIVNVLAWIVLLLALLITVLVFSSSRNNDVANLMGFIPMTVESDSMKPTFSKDDLIICREIDDVKSLKKGDVITFWTIIDGKKVKNTHRIVAVNEGGKSFVTRGDNNNQDDTMPAYAGDVIGKWTEFKIGGAGKAMDFLRTKKGFFICIIIPMALFFLFELYKFIVVVMEAKREGLTEEDEEEIKKKAIEEYLASQKKDEAEKAGEKPEEKAEKAEEKSEKAEEKAEDKAEEKPEDKSEKAEDEAPKQDDETSDGEDKSEEKSEEKTKS